MLVVRGRFLSFGIASTDLGKILSQRPQLLNEVLHLSFEFEEFKLLRG